MELTVAVGQLDPTEDARRNWSVALGLAERASAAGAQVLVLPEQAMLAQRAGDPARFASMARAAWDWWPAAVSAAAQSLSLAIVAGGFAPAGDGPASQAADQRPFNVLLAVDASGQTVACQAKTRLYDAFEYRESGMVRPGPGPGDPDGPRPVALAGVTFGLVNCYELRFPELARHLTGAGAEALALGAAWVRGPLKEDQWVTLARARAIENCAYVLAAGTRAKDTIGRSMVIDPGGVVVAGLADEPQGLALATLDTGRVAEARSRARSLP
jgi:predicted amidohydrolase